MGTTGLPCIASVRRLLDGITGPRPRRTFPIILAIAPAVICSDPAVAHHSVAVFDSTREVVLEGTVRTMEWANPHVWIRLNVTDADGNVVEWGVEASNPLDLGRKGWTRKTFKPDDKVTIIVHPAKNDRPFGSFIRATLPDGSTLGESEETAEAGEKAEE